MALTIGEKIGAALAFVPGLSIVSGLIMAYVYYNRAKEDGIDPTNMINTANKVSDTANKHLLNRETIHHSYEKLWKASLVGTIPFVNILAAAYSVFTLHQLSEARDENDPTKSYKDVAAKYRVNLKDPTLPANLIEVLLIIDQLDLKDKEEVISQGNFTTTKKIIFSAEEVKKTIAAYSKGACAASPNMKANQIVKNVLGILINDSKIQFEENTKKIDDLTKAIPSMLLDKVRSQSIFSRERYQEENKQFQEIMNQLEEAKKTI